MPGITVRGLVESPRLKAKVLAGADGLEAAVAWAHVAEVVDPVPFLEGGELILTGGLGIPQAAEDQVKYLRRLHEHGVVGVAIAGGGFAPPLTPAALAEADRLPLSLLDLPFEVSFVDIARLVASSNERGGQDRLVKHLQIFETLQEYQASAMPVEELVERLSVVSGFELYATSPAGTPILPGLPVPPPEVVESRAHASYDQVAIPGGYVLPLVVAGRMAAELTAIRRNKRSPAGLAAAQYLATVLGIPLRDLYQSREAERREGAEILSRLLGGDGSSRETASDLVERGFEPMRELVVVLIRSRDERFDDAEINHRLCDRRLPSLLATREDLVAVVPDVEEAMVAIEQVDFEVAVGVSGPFAPGKAIAVPWRQARWSLGQAVAHGRRLVRFTPADAASEWLPIDRGQLRGVVDDIVGPLLRYDSAHGSELVESLRTLLRHNRRIKPAAAQLGIHHHTLAYRMRTVERLSGRPLKELHGLVDLWLGMKALDLLSGERQSPPDT
ncbi:MAG TPA: PucR family transcriptional regulator ligand-binding domain-containing protein [Thermoleophilaceae bacterium]|nr:PucR family transcriptional regulator ligand-binding domain-containing protein [Thermoleophilaceae bacterium]